MVDYNEEGKECLDNSELYNNPILYTHRENNVSLYEESHQVAQCITILGKKNLEKMQKELDEKLKKYLE